MKTKLTLRQQVKAEKLRAERYWASLNDKLNKIDEFERLVNLQVREIERLKDEVAKLRDYKVKFKMLKNLFKPAILNLHKDTIGWDRDKQDRYFDNI